MNNAVGVYMASELSRTLELNWYSTQINVGF